MFPSRPDVTGFLHENLPHEAARAVLRIAYPQRFAYLRSLRAPPASSGRRLTLAPYLESRSIFVHIPKCAGISMLQALYGRTEIGGHLSIGEYKTAFTAQEYAGAFKFAFVRNPWDRVRSGYQYLKSGGRKPKDKVFAAQSVDRTKDFEEFVLRWLDRRVDSNPDAPPHFRSQLFYICLADRRRHQMDFIGRFENIEADFAIVRERLGVDAALGKMNANRRGGDWRSDYTPAMRDKVGAVYREEIELLGYEFD